MPGHGASDGIFGHSRALRAVVLAWGMAWFGPAAGLAAGTLNSPEPSDLIERSAEPFGLFASHLADGGLRGKWLGVQRRLDDEMVQLALCDGDRDRCASPAALQFLAIVDTAKAREGRARLGEINRAINLAIRPMSDLEQYGEIDVWSSPLATFVRGSGRLRRLRDRKIRCIAARRRLTRRSADRDHARHHPGRGSCRCRRAAGWALADARQSPHGDGRGRACQELPAEFCHRSRSASSATRKRRCLCSGTATLFRKRRALPELKHRRCDAAAIRAVTMEAI